MLFLNHIKKKCLVIAEIGPNHNGSLKRALKLIDEAKKSGCHGVKFQYRIADQELFDKKTKSYYYNESRYNFIKRVQEFSFEDHKKIRDYVKTKKLFYICSIFSEKSYFELLKLKPDALKIPSGEATNLFLLKKIRNSKIPIIISFGMSSEKEITKSVNILSNKTKNIILLHCISEYPTNINDLNLSYLKRLKNLYNFPVGISDHSMMIDAIASSVHFGSKLIEVHFTLDRKLKGPDHKVSLMPKEINKLVNKVEYFEKALGKPIKKLGKHLVNMKLTFTNSLVASKELEKGIKLKKYHLKAMKPGTGIPINQATNIIGKKLNKNYKKNQPFKFKDLI